MKKITSFLVLAATLLSADITIDQAAVNTQSAKLDQVFTNLDVKTLRELKFTDVDQRFVNFTSDLITEEVISAGKTFGEGFSFSNLGPYAEKISSFMGSDLTGALTDNILSQDGYFSMLDSSFLEGFKSEALTQIQGLDFLDSSQISELANAIMDGNSLGAISNVLDGMSFDYFDKAIGEWAQYVPTSFADAADKLGDALTSTKASFACVCSSQLSSAFSRFQSHIIDDNLSPIYANLNALASTIENNIQVLQSKAPIIAQSNQAYTGKIVEAQAYLHALEQELALLNQERE